MNIKKINLLTLIILFTVFILSPFSIYAQEEIDRTNRDVQLSGTNSDTISTNNQIGDTSLLQVPGKYYALIIGINNYKSFKQLSTAIKDAQSVSEILKKDYGFTTKLLLDEQATRKNILEALNDYRQKLTENDKLLIYYAGHGYFDKDVGMAYWFPIDALKDDPTSWLPASDLTTNIHIKRISARQILIVADSCYSGMMTRSTEVKLSAGETRIHYLEKLLKKPARVLISSGGDEPVADAGGEGHSIFADSFIKALKKNMDKGIFTADELLMPIKESVGGCSDQTPDYQYLQRSGHDGGDFIFVSSIRNYTPQQTNITNAKLPQQTPVIPKDGRLMITSDPVGAQCYINNNLVGNTPIDLNFPPGTYELRLEMNGFKNFDQKVLLLESRSVQINHIFTNNTGSIIVQTNPEGTMIYIDGIYIGSAPQTIPNINSGTHLLELKRNGYNTWSNSINVIPGKSLTIKAELIKPEPQPEKEVYKEYQEPERKRSRLSAPLPSF